MGSIIHKDELKKEPGIYAIINLAEKKIYIGKTENLHKRFNQHKNELLRNEHFNKWLQNDFNNGADFEFKPIQLFNERPPYIDHRITEYLYMFYFYKRNYIIYNFSDSKGQELHEQMAYIAVKIAGGLVFSTDVAQIAHEAIEKGN
jgi:hypothetical protein